jgi:hypothetical protein
MLDAWILELTLCIISFVVPGTTSTYVIRVSNNPFQHQTNNIEAGETTAIVLETFSEARQNGSGRTTTSDD